jgi:hypothetical protein
MIIDIREYPRDHIFTEVVAKQFGIYVHVAQFNEHHDIRMFRMIVDSGLSVDELKKIMSARICDKEGGYVFERIESISGPLVEEGPSKSQTANYLRITFM